jgi:hypothetical protein
MLAIIHILPAIDLTPPARGSPRASARCLRACCQASSAGRGTDWGMCRAYHDERIIARCCAFLSPTSRGEGRRYAAHRRPVWTVRIRF